MSSCSLKWYSPASSPGHWWPVRVALPRNPPSPASYLYSRRTWLPKTAYWKWGRIYRRTIFPVWWFQECKHRTMDFMTKSTTESFLWLPNFRKSHHLSATWKMSGVRCWYCPWHDFWYLGFQGKTGGSRPPVFGFQQSFLRKIGSWGFHQIRQIVTPCHLKFNFFFWKRVSSWHFFFNY